MSSTADVLFLWRGEWSKEKKKEVGSQAWKELFQSLKDIVPKDYLVIVSADRELYADWLYEEITTLNWHPLIFQPVSLNKKTC